MNVERLAVGACGRPFPVYDDLVGNLLAAHGSADAGRDAVVAHVLGTFSGYAYADIETVAMIMARLGLGGGACVRIAQIVDAMHIFSTAYLVQSRCGRTAILCYRGTEPANLGNWLTDADVGSDSITLGGNVLAVHAGMLRNVGSTLRVVLDELNLALQGRSLRDPMQSVERPLEALYVAGHSLGGAMAVLFALCLARTAEHREIAGKLRAIYTFGQPLVTGEPLPEAAREVGRKLYRHVNARDLVPSLPPAAWDTWRISDGSTATRKASGGRRIFPSPNSSISEKFHARSWPFSAPRSAGTLPATRWTSTAPITTSRRFGRRARSTSLATRVDRRSHPVPRRTTHPASAASSRGAARSAARPARRD